MTLHLAWIAMTVLRLAGIAVVFAGVALFGYYFIAGNAQASDKASQYQSNSHLVVGAQSRERNSGVNL